MSSTDFNARFSPFGEDILSPGAFHRLLPSDLKKLSYHLSHRKGAYRVLEEFVLYILRMKNPTSVEIDDIQRITAQLNSIGLWDEIPPSFFIRSFSSVIDEEVLRVLAAALRVNFEDTQLPPKEALHHEDVEFMKFLVNIIKGRKKELGGPQ